MTYKKHKQRVSKESDTKAYQKQFEKEALVNLLTQLQDELLGYIN